MQSQQPIKWYKVSRRSLEPVYIEQDRLEAIMSDPQQLIKYYDVDGEWRVMNKADISDAVYDRTYSRVKNEPKYRLYRNKETNTVLKLLDGQLPDDFSKYDPI